METIEQGQGRQHGVQVTLSPWSLCDHLIINHNFL